MMKMRQLLVATIVLAALGATLYWSNHRKPTNDSVIAGPSTANAKIISLNQDDISKLEVKKKDGDDVVLNRAGASAWKITSPKPLVADQNGLCLSIFSGGGHSSLRLRQPELLQIGGLFIDQRGAIHRR